MTKYFVQALLLSVEAFPMEGAHFLRSVTLWAATGTMNGKRRVVPWFNSTRILSLMFLQAIDVPDTDLLHHFERCCQFIKQGVEQGGILVHFCGIG